MKILIIQHEDDCPPAWFGVWLTEAGCQIDVRRAHAGDALPDDLARHDAMVILGGSMSANDDVHWFPALERLTQEAQDSGLPTLGICLGHQFLATRCGGVVAPNPLGQAFGLSSVGWLDAAADDPLMGGLLDVTPCVQFNDDIVVTVPPDATVLAQSPVGEVQALRFGPAMWGVQWHPEVDVHTVTPWAEDELHRYGAERVAEALADVATAHEDLMAGWRRLAEAFVELIERP